MITLTLTRTYAYLLAITLTFATLLSLHTPAQAQASFSFPGHAEDLRPGEYWAWPRLFHDDGNQFYGYDLIGLRFSAAAKKWTSLRAEGLDGKNNSDYVLYGKPVYAVSSGTVIAAWRNAPENYGPGKSHFGRIVEPPIIPAGGNYLLVQHDDGSLLLYAHMIPGTIPTTLCPNNGVFVANAHLASTDPNYEPYIPEGQRPRIYKGQFVGRVGNSGKAGEVHLHIHTCTANSQALMLPFANVWIKSAVEGQPDTGGDWHHIVTGTQLYGPLIIRPDFQTFNLGGVFSTPANAQARPLFAGL